MRILDSNPHLMPAFLGFVFTAFIVVMGFALARKMRHDLLPSGTPTRGQKTGDNASFSLSTFDGVIRSLRDQQAEMEKSHAVETLAAKEAGSIQEAVWNNLETGVVYFNSAGIVRQVNPAAKMLLGYVSPFHMHVRDIFRGVTNLRLSEPDANLKVSKGSGGENMAEVVEACTLEGAVLRNLEAEYQTPAGKASVLKMTVAPVRGAKGDALGTVVLVVDFSANIRLS